MKTKEEILKGRELQIEDFAGRGNHLAVFSKGIALASMDTYAKQEHFERIFDQYTLSEIEFSIPAKY